MNKFPQPFFLNCAKRPSRASCLPPPANLSFRVLIRSNILLPLVLFLPQTNRSPRPADSKKGGADINREMGSSTVDVGGKLLFHVTSRFSCRPDRYFSFYSRGAIDLLQLIVTLPTLVICIQLPALFCSFSLLSIFFPSLARGLPNISAFSKSSIPR